MSSATTYSSGLRHYTYSFTVAQALTKGVETVNVTPCYLRPSILRDHSGINLGSRHPDRHISLTQLTLSKKSVWLRQYHLHLQCPETYQSYVLNTHQCFRKLYQWKCQSCYMHPPRKMCLNPVSETTNSCAQRFSFAWQHYAVICVTAIAKRLSWHCYANLE